MQTSTDYVIVYICRFIYSRISLPKIPFCTNIRSNSKMSIKPCFLNGLHKPHQIISPFKIILKRNPQNKIPTFTNLNNIKPKKIQSK